MKTKLLALVLFCIAFCCVGCGGNSEPTKEDAKESVVETKDEPEEVKEETVDYIDHIDLEGIEDGWIYWTVYFNDDLKWNSTNKCGKIAVDAIKECYAKEETTEDLKVWVIGNSIDGGYQYFSWSDNQEDIIYLYEDNVKKREYQLMSTEIDTMKGRQ